MITYQIDSLVDLANLFENNAKRSDEKAGMARLQRERDIFNHETYIWKQAAEIARNTTMKVK